MKRRRERRSVPQAPIFRVDQMFSQNDGGNLYNVFDGLEDLGGENEDFRTTSDGLSNNEGVVDCDFENFSPNLLSISSGQQAGNGDDITESLFGAPLLPSLPEFAMEQGNRNEKKRSRRERESLMLQTDDSKTNVIDSEGLQLSASSSDRKEAENQQMAMDVKAHDEHLSMLKNEKIPSSDTNSKSNVREGKRKRRKGNAASASGRLYISQSSELGSLAVKRTSDELCRQLQKRKRKAATKNKQTTQPIRRTRKKSKPTEIDLLTSRADQKANEEAVRAALMSQRILRNSLSSKTETPNHLLETNRDLKVLQDKRLNSGIFKSPRCWFCGETSRLSVPSKLLRRSFPNLGPNGRVCWRHTEPLNDTWPDLLKLQKLHSGISSKIPESIMKVVTETYSPKNVTLKTNPYSTPPHTGYTAQDDGSPRHCVLN